MSKPAIIAIIICGGVVALALLFVAIYFFVIRKNKLRKEFHTLDKSFQYYHGLLIGQNSQYVRRLEIISRTNLLYVEIHTKFLKQFKEIRDKQDATVSSEINNLADLINDHHFKQGNKYLPTVKRTVEQFEHSVSELNRQLLDVIRPEEDCRQASLVLKEQFRRLKQEYNAKSNDLVMLINTFEKVFGLIDSKFEDFETLVESAQYDEATNLLPEIEHIHGELSNAMNDLPNLCALVNDILPNKLSDLENAYRQMKNDNYPLEHLSMDKRIAYMRSEVENYKDALKKFALKGLPEQIEAMLNTIDELQNKFVEEKEARKAFDEQNDLVYRNVNLIERRFIKLCNIIPEISKIYIINAEHSAKVNVIKTDINKVGALKRSLDTCIHSSIKQPYSLLVVKMNELKEASDSIIEELDEFDSYLASLKVDSEEAYKLIFSFFNKLKHAEKDVRDINIARLSEKYAKEFNRCYELLNEINNLLKKTPIDVDAVNNNVSELYDVSNNILDGGSIEQEANMMTLAENAIMYANKGRAHLTDIDQLVSQAEAFFRDGDFEQAYIIAGNALKKIKANNERQ